jgi:pimeloyl-ACP methyl ester carboxylesterase
VSATIASVVVGSLLFILAILLGFYWYCVRTYSSVIDRIFAEKPILIADRGTPLPRAEMVTLQTADGRRIEGSLIQAETDQPLGTILFLHEYGSDRWMAGPYAGYLTDAGFDLFAIDFGACGQSDPVPGYEPLQWPTEFELEDARSAIRFLKEGSRTPERLGLFGISKGGGVAICLFAEEPAIRSLVTDGAFPVHDMVVYYAMKWIEIYSTSRFIYTYLPRWFYSGIVSSSLRGVERKKEVRYLPVEKAVRQRSDGSWLLIHGKNDNYIKQEVIERLFAVARCDKELWIVPKAKHNHCLKREGKNYEARVTSFLRKVFEPLAPAVRSTPSESG